MSNSFTDRLFSFGIVADPQYAAQEPNITLNRYYRRSLDKLFEAIEVFNKEDLTFVMTLGDVIDRHSRSFDDILSVYERLRHRSLFILGNHDFLVEPHELDAIHEKLGMSSRYYSFAHQGIRFIALDGNEVSLFAPPLGHPYRTSAKQRLAELTASGAINAHEWNAAMSDTQLAWFLAELEKAENSGERVIIMNHYPVYPSNEHDAWDRDRILEALTGKSHVIGYFSGHNHVGNFGTTGNVSFVNFKGMVDTENDNSFAVVDVHPDKLVVRGFGREDSRTLFCDGR
ncbi:metallophosphoesterase [Oryzifoliimicrobium ureilyticus]|uniref:metallophosphoesterase n=1 Tax=Oryzifoliimicrobium ureilyticus TaxID=3113724 RepID=UPI0030767FFF